MRGRAANIILFPVAHLILHHTACELVVSIDKQYDQVLPTSRPATAFAPSKQYSAAKRKTGALRSSAAGTVLLVPTEILASACAKGMNRDDFLFKEI